jgi:glycosyltransferase involved in cell wall biosynthesis
MHLLGLVKGPDHVCCRYRLAAFQGAFAGAGHDLELRPWPQRWLANLWFHHGLRHADAVVLQRRLPPSWQLALIRRASKRLIFDLDDAVFLNDSYSPQGLGNDRRLRAFARVARAADIVVAGNAFLAAQAARWTDPAKVHVIPTCVDPDRYRVAGHDREGEGVRLAWIGSSSTLQGLNLSRPLWDRVGWRLPGLALKLICDKSLSLRYLPVHFRPWSEATEAAELADADIGISWLPDDDWSRGKCGLKVLQYMAAGLPVVANAVGVQAEMVVHGETGFLAETADEWVTAVGRLANDAALRRRMGAAARRLVEEEFSVATGARRWLEVLDPRARAAAPAAEEVAAR